MIKWFKRQQESELQTLDDSTSEEKSPSTDTKLSEPKILPKKNLFSRFKEGLSKTRHQFGESISGLLLGKKEINQDLLDELETLLVRADVGIETAQMLLKQVTDSLERNQLSDGNTVYDTLKMYLEDLLQSNSKELLVDTEDHAPFVILMVGVNGSGKTTTIGKLAKQFQMQGKKVMLAAGDTFRAAAVEQLQLWGERNGIAVIAQQTGADSASVLFDALAAAKARHIDVLIADTAGRLHTQINLMEELKKIKRVLQKLDPKAPHEIMLVLDASIGQNALTQAKQFHEAVNLSGITMTKLDGTAKGGILFAIANELKIPFRYIGVGEGIEDLQPFDAAQFVGALFNDDHM